MTQILSGICSEGIMVATDSMATIFDANGEERYFTIDKLFSIGSHAFIVSGGMGISVELSKRFKQYVEERQLVGIEAIVAAGGPYLSDQFKEALQNLSNERVRRDKVERIYFVVGGYSFRDQNTPYQLALWGSESGQHPLQRMQIGPCLAVPRTMSGEMKLLKLCQGNCPLVELVEFAEEFLQKQAKSNPQIGPPFRLGTVTASGFTRLERSRELRENQKK